MSSLSPRVTLLALIGAFALSQAYRTIAGIMAPPLQADLQLDAAQLGSFAAMFHLVFGAMQLFMGVGIDVYGVRRVMLWVFPLAAVGAALSAVAPDLPLLLLGQALIGVGCAPAFVACTVFIAQGFAIERFAAISGVALGLGSLGMLLTASPLAWVIEAGSWRAAFAALAALSALAWLALWAWIRLPAPSRGVGDSVLASLRGFVGLLAVPHTWGIVLLGLMVYAAIMALRGLWLGPLLVDQQGFSLARSGDVALLMSLLMLLGAPVLGRLDPGPRWRRCALVVVTLGMAVLFAVLAWCPTLPVAVGVPLLVGALSSYTIWQYADVRAAYPPDWLGRAIGLFTMSMFLGVALMQALTGWVAKRAVEAGLAPYPAVFLTVAALLLLGALGFACLPKPPGSSRPAPDATTVA